MVYEMRTTHPLIHDEFKFGDAEQEFFKREGYYIFDRFLTDEAIEEGRSHIDRIIEQRAEGFVGTEMMAPHQLGEKWFWDIMTDPKVIDFAEKRLGPNLVLWHADLLNKEPGVGREIHWHQDQMYWDQQQVRAPLANLWIPFDDVDEHNGTLSVLPRWHNKGLLSQATIDAADGAERTSVDEVARDGDFFGYSVDPSELGEDADHREVVYRFRAGQAATHSSYLPHRSTPNQSGAWRRAMTCHFMRADADEMGDRHYISYLDRREFDREYYLVRGEDVNNRGLKRSPFE